MVTMDPEATKTNAGMHHVIASELYCSLTIPQGREYIEPVTSETVDGCNVPSGSRGAESPKTEKRLGQQCCPPMSEQYPERRNVKPKQDCCATANEGPGSQSGSDSMNMVNVKY